MILTPGPVSISPLQFLFASFYRSLALAPHLSLLTSPHRCHGAVPQSCAASSSIPSLSTLLLLQPHVFTQGSRAVISLCRLKYCTTRRPLPFIFFFFLILFFKIHLSPSYRILPNSHLFPRFRTFCHLSHMWSFTPQTDSVSAYALQYTSGSNQAPSQTVPDTLVGLLLLNCWDLCTLLSTLICQDPMPLFHCHLSKREFSEKELEEYFHPKRLTECLHLVPKPVHYYRFTGSGS